jgi:Ion channel
MAKISGSNFSQPLTRTDPLYFFTVTVFSTEGFGDITAKSQAARLVVTAQMVTDLVVLGLVIKVIVSAVRQVRAARPLLHHRDPPWHVPDQPYLPSDGHERDAAAITGSDRIRWSWCRQFFAGHANLCIYDDLQSPSTYATCNASNQFEWMIQVVTPM